LPARLKENNLLWRQKRDMLPRKEDMLSRRKDMLLQRNMTLRRLHRDKLLSRLSNSL
jgi:hypothetical protein